MSLLHALLLHLALAAGAQGLKPATVQSGSVPGGVNYQGRLEQDGVPVTGNRSMVFRLFNASSGGTQLWSSGPQTVAVQQGLFAAALDLSTAALSGTAQKYLELEIEGQVLSPRDPLRSVPYALVARALEGDLDISGAEFKITAPAAGDILYVSSVTGNVGIGTTSPGRRLTVFAPLGTPSLRQTNGTHNADFGLGGSASFAGTGIYFNGLQRANFASNLGVSLNSYAFNLADPPADGMIVPGNVGIGTPGPGARLHVSSGGVIIDGNGASLSVGVSTFVVASGRVGVGSASPAARLHVSGGDLQVGDAAASTVSASGYVAFANRTTDPPAAPGRVFYDANGAGALKVALNNGVFVPLSTGSVAGGGGLSGSGVATRVAFWDGAASLNSSSNLYWDNVGGLLGIGTTSPQAGLHVAGGSGSLSLHDAAVPGLMWKADHFNPDGELRVRTALPTDGSGVQDVLVLEPGGETGMGTVAPSARLHVSSAGATASDIIFKVSSGAAASQDLFAVRGDGRVGVGTTSPPAPLSVASTTKGFRANAFVDVNASACGLASIGSNLYLNQADNVWKWSNTHTSLGGTAIQFNDCTGSPNSILFLRAVGATTTDANAPVVESMRIDPYGNVGVGVAAPTARLHVSSAGATASDAVLKVSSGPSAGQELLTVLGGGRVGVGTGSPVAGLDVQVPHYLRGGNGDTNGDGVVSALDILIIINYMNSGVIPSQEQYARGDINGDGRLNTLDIDLITEFLNSNITIAQAQHSVGKEVLDRLIRPTYTTRRLGINTSPGATLHVSKEDAAAGDQILLISTGSAASQELLSVTGGGRVKIGALPFTNAFSDLELSDTFSGAQGRLSFNARSQVSDTQDIISVGGQGMAFRVAEAADTPYVNDIEAVRISTNGGVGIGAASPEAKLHVVGGTGALIPLTVQQTDSNSEVIRVRNLSGNPMFLVTLQGANNIPTFYDYNTGSVQPSISLSGGNVGIKTIGPNDALHVAGDARVGTGTTGCVKDADATVIAGTCSSDLRLKKDVEPFADVLDRLVRLTPVHFHWRKDQFPDRHFGSAESYGLVAQEVERLLPELVVEDEKGYKAVRYGKLPFLMLQSIKEQQREIEELKREIRRLAAE